MHQAGICPKCGCINLDYDSQDSGFQDGSYYYNYKCESCDFEGAEWYDLVFTEHLDRHGNQVGSQK